MDHGHRGDAHANATRDRNGMTAPRGRRCTRRSGVEAACQPAWDHRCLEVALAGCDHLLVPSESAVRRVRRGRARCTGRSATRTGAALGDLDGGAFGRVGWASASVSAAVTGPLTTDQPTRGARGRCWPGNHRRSGRCRAGRGPRRSGRPRRSRSSCPVPGGSRTGPTEDLVAGLVREVAADDFIR
jgi:hypothetical protein